MNVPPPTPKQAAVIWYAVTALSIAVLLAVICLLIWAAGQVLAVLSPVLWPLAIAGVVAYLLDPVVDFLERRGVPRTRGILCVFALALAVLVGIGGQIVPQVVTETRQLIRQIPTYTKRLQDRAERWMTNSPPTLRGTLWSRFFQTGTNVPPSGTSTNVVEPATTNLPPAQVETQRMPSLLEQALGSDALESATGWVTRLAPRAGGWFLGQVTRVASWFGVLAGLFLVPVYTFYFLLEKARIRSRWADYLPLADSSIKSELVFVLSSINDYLITFFRSQVLVAICDGILYTIGFLLIGLPYAVLIGFIATFLTIIPYLGAIVTCLTALVIAFVQYGDWKHPLLVLAVFGVVQTIEGLVIAPKIVGDRVGLHPLTIIVAVMAGTTLFGGILGGILAIPFTATLRVLMFRYVWGRSGRKPATATVSTDDPQL